MQTSKLISTISFNTSAFLRGRCFDLVRQGLIEYAYWIEHKPEEDEKKSHFHVLIKPNKRLDTSALRNVFVEVVAGEDKPRGVLPFQTSKTADWLQYAIHDIGYLIQKGQDRRWHYDRADVQSTDPENLEEDWRGLVGGANALVPRLEAMAKAGQSWKEVLSSNFLPVNQLFQYKEIFFAFKDPKTARGGHYDHIEL